MKPILVYMTLCLFTFPGLAIGETITLPVTEAHKRVVIALWEGDIDVTATRESRAVVDTECERREPAATSDDGGFRSLRSSAVLPDIVVSDEVIVIRTYEDDSRCSVTLALPEGLDLHARINRVGSIAVDAWRGSLLAWSADGDVSVTNHSGSLSVTAMNGDATVSLIDPGIDADSAITAANGTLTLTVSPDSVPALRAQARWGDIQTNLDTTFEEVVEAGGTWFATKREDADPVLTMRNLNRDIIIRNSIP